MLMQVTPFDKIIKNQQSDSISGYLGHARLFRASYINMVNASDDFYKEGVEIFKAAQAQVKTGIKKNHFSSFRVGSIRAYLAYFEFCSLVNIIGRKIKVEYQKTLPKFEEIRFYRNKVIEHVDEYLGAITAPNAMSKMGSKIAIPFHTDSRVNYQDLKSAFEVYHVNLPQKEPGDISKRAPILYQKLKEIDPYLTRIHKNLVDKLFQSSFPTPILDVEQYCDELVIFLENLK